MNEYVVKLKYTIKIKVKMKDLSKLIFFSSLSLSLFYSPHPSLSFPFVSISSFYLTCHQV